MDIQNSVLCLEPIRNTKNASTQSFFMPCNSSPEQKWKFVKANENETTGRIIHQKSGNWLSFKKTPEKSQSTRYSKVKMLSFLSNIVNEIGLTIESPVLEPCEKNKSSNRYQLQIWSIDSPVNLSYDI